MDSVAVRKPIVGDCGARVNNRGNTMLEIKSYTGVTRFDLARTLLGRGRCWTAAYWVDGIMVDTGSAHTARELVQALTSTPLTRIVNTHSHEDHIGANRFTAATTKGAGNPGSPVSRARIGRSTRHPITPSLSARILGPSRTIAR